MGLAYTKEFLIDAATYRYKVLGEESYKRSVELAKHTWNISKTKDQFRKYASLDADAIKQYKKYLEGQ